MALRLAGEGYSLVQGLDTLGFVREVVANDSEPTLRLRQNGSGRILEMVDAGGTVRGYVNAAGDLVALKDIDAQGAIKNTGAANGGQVYIDDDLELTGHLQGGGSYLSGFSSLGRGTTVDSLVLSGAGLGVGGGAKWSGYGKGHANAGRADQTTPNVAGNVDVLRLELAGNVDQGLAGIKVYENLKMQMVSSKFQSIEVPVKAGALADADFNDAQNGLLAVDSTNGRLYLRYSGAWHYFAVTA
jgi:hypothetical protein